MSETESVASLAEGKMAGKMATRPLSVLVVASALLAFGCTTRSKSAPHGGDDTSGGVDGAQGAEDGSGTSDSGQRSGDGLSGALDAKASHEPVPFDAPSPVDARPFDDAPPPAGCQATVLDYGNSLTDLSTCLTWQKQKQPPRTNTQAARYCADLVLDGFSDWRVPAPEELATWPALTDDSNAYVTNPTYVPVSGSVMDGCTGNSHSCNLTEYSAGSVSCAWQGVGFMGASICVRGIAVSGTLATKFAAGNCDACRAHVAGVSADFKVADCVPYVR